MKNIITIMSVFLLSASSTFASWHCSNCPDKAFRDLGQQFPSVGCFVSEHGEILETGTLINIGAAELKGRVVVSCAHIFKKNQKSILFKVGNQKPVRGTVYRHPNYLKLAAQRSQSHPMDAVDDRTSYDLSIIILQSPIQTVVPAEVDLESSSAALMDKPYISVGYGRTGHVFGHYIIEDEFKRASYSYASRQTNKEFDRKWWLPKSEKNQSRPLLSLTPYKAGYFLSPTSSLEVYQKPAGIAQAGNSGGPTFTQNGKQIGVIVTRSEPELARQLVFEKSLFNKYKNAILKIFEQEQQEYDEKLASLQDDPEALKQCMQNSLTPSLLPPIKISQIDAYMEPVYHPSLFNETGGCYVFCNTLLLSFHKDWILATLSKHDD